ncbi:hypothetical protein TVAG_263920 [Trichomonas vaginalis G3]|uniref:Uncharacterized protein n=1 Tax=Trichomonas vaginalis (strain ATCC PRA-98 / G3) TaxID=412133 RepID=A2EP18_TRIV3|nr:hypothetical protein TVAGG3_0945710 [Trichomonas vaginalis G3]EAY05622.1 hypothetical protein TVAG_263920 [Trichomonas vaginalis G3]KAI5486862.1 hypothetical protein TVAGG3_0945710 [Trichomonas vaginalis G3]|eukprot:XP_001317845.1 hypothetical protein [Trichomonas vaginalis G3]
MTNDTRNYVINCGGQFINYHKPTFTGEHDFWSDPYIQIHHFIKLHLHELNRVIVCDLFDTIFQGDPFNDYLPKNQLNLADEGHSIDYLNKGWIDKCAPLEGYDLDSLKVINAGYFGGDANVILNFFSVYLGNFQFGMGKVDQGCIIGWTYSGLFEKYGVPVKISNDNVRHLSWAKLKHGEELGSVRGINRRDLTVAILHQTHWDGALFKKLKDICPQPPGDFKDYLGYCKSC